jgi:hypothetical protein
MGIDKESDVSANLQIGPTTLGMVRIYVEGEGIDLPLDFDPEEAEEIAEEIRMAAQQARAMQGKPSGKPPLSLSGRPGASAEDRRGPKPGKAPQKPTLKPPRR